MFLRILINFFSDMFMSENKNWKTATAALVGTVLVLTVIIAALLYTQTISASGTVTAVKAVNCAVYADPAGTQVLTQINWGALEPGSALNVTVYVKNTGNTPVNYTVTTSNFSPSNAGSYISLEADLKGAKNLSPGAITPIVLTNVVASTAPVGTSYSYDIKITASG